MGKTEKFIITRLLILAVTLYAAVWIFNHNFISPWLGIGLGIVIIYIIIKQFIKEFSQK